MYICKKSCMRGTLREEQKVFVTLYVCAAGELCYNVSTRVKFGSNSIIN
jgi:hypothetical protein